MEGIGKYLIGFAILVVAGIFCWYFSDIIIYVLVAAVVSFLGGPIIIQLGRVRIKGHSLPNAVKAGIALTCIWTLFILFFSTIIPLVASEFQSLGNISVGNIITELETPLNDMGKTLKHYGLIEQDEDVTQYVTANLNSVVNVAKVKSVFGSLAGTVSSLFIALFSVSFISFFFLKDSRLFSDMVLALMPSRYEEQARNALDSIQRLLVRYFVGLVLEMVGVMALNTIGLTLVGVDFNNAIVIGLVTGVLNVIPYIGPIIGMVFGVSVGIVLNLDVNFYLEVLPLLVYMMIVFLTTQLIDNLFFQPYIYGNSVHAHPLEIFLVILMAGSLAGIPGMILAIPGYTVLRVLLREFFNKYRLVKKLTQNMH